MTEVGKFGKSLGDPSPRDRRHEPLAERATPAKPKKSKRPTNWGYSFRTKHPWRVGTSDRHYVWFESEAARNQSMKKMMRDQNDRYRAYYVEITPIDHKPENKNAES
jgi:hypothetical protein